MAVGQLVFMSQDVFSKENGFYPTHLLDDISSELDKENTKEVLNKELLEKQQTFITVIDLKHIPKDILNRSQVIDISSF
jgi:recombinational DNA repair ATPase RecF